MTDIKRIVELVSGTENTTELSQYWARKYTSFLNDGLFEISAKTIQISKLSKVTNPFTPEAGIYVYAHQDNQGNVDEEKFKITVEVAARFLDSLLDIINFDTNTKKTIASYRKISLSVLDFNKYKKHTNKKVDHIQYVGRLFSHSAYRASEYIAEEKGAFKNWQEFKTKLMPKGFIYWYDTETGNIENGFDVYNNYSQEEIEESSFEVLPRRNSHIISPPITPEWVEFSDREIVKQSKIEEDIIPQKDSKEEIQKETIMQSPKFSLGELVEITNKFNKSSIYQVSGIKQTNNETIYSLTNGEESIKESENSIREVSLEDIVKKINNQKTHTNTKKDPLPAKGLQKDNIELYYRREINKNIENIMSTYSLKLEKTIEHSQFGEVNIELSYNSQGIKNIKIDNQKIEHTFGEYINPILNLTNLSLKEGIDKDKVLKNIQPKNDHSEFGQILEMITQVVTEAPLSLHDITPSILQPTAIQEKHNTIESQDEIDLEPIEERVVEQLKTQSNDKQETKNSSEKPPKQDSYVKDIQIDEIDNNAEIYDQEPSRLSEILKPSGKKSSTTFNPFSR